MGLGIPHWSHINLTSLGTLWDRSHIHPILITYLFHIILVICGKGQAIWDGSHINLILITYLLHIIRDMRQKGRNIRQIPHPSYCQTSLAEMAMFAVLSNKVGLGTFKLLLNTFEYFWYSLVLLRYFWVLLGTFVYFWILLSTFEYFWVLLSTFEYFWIL